MSTEHPYEEMFRQDIAEAVAGLLKLNTNMSTAEAMKQATAEMMKNNPFVPPSGCPINDLPNELLAHIFEVGKQMEMDGDDSDEDDDDDGFDLADEWEDTDDEEIDETAAQIPGSFPGEKADRKGSETPEDGMQVDGDQEDDGDDEELEELDELPFPILVSHVCRHWRDVATGTPSLWTALKFSLGSPLDKARAYLERSKALPLEIVIDCSAPEGWEPEEDSEDAAEDSHPEGLVPNVKKPPRAPLPFLSIDALNEILDLIIPHVDRWYGFEMQASLYESLYIVLSRLTTAAAAPILESLRFYHYEDSEEFDAFQPVQFRTPFLLFGGDVPNLKNLALWGVHIDWDA